MTRQADATRAGGEAARAAARHDDAALATVFASDAYPLEALLTAIRGVLGEATPIVGCSTAGEIATGAAHGQDFHFACLLDPHDFERLLERAGTEQHV